MNARKTVGYIRVSTEDQAENGVSLAAQRERLEAWAVATGRHIDEIIADEGVSAKNLKRPGMKRMMQGVEDGEIGAVVVLKIDRISRSLEDLLYLIKRFQQTRTEFASVMDALDTSTAIGRFFIQLKGALAELESGQTGERTKMALTHKRRDGKAYGPTPYGWKRVGDKLVKDEDQQRVVGEIRYWIGRIGLSYRAMCDKLRETGRKPPNGKEWHPSSVRSILSNKMNTAEFV